MLSANPASVSKMPSCQCSICSLPTDELEASDQKRNEIKKIQADVSEMIKWGQIKHAYGKSLDILNIAADLGVETYSVLPQLYLDSYQLCRKFYGEHSTNEETIKLFDKGHEWAMRLRGNNTLFSTLERPVMG